MKSFDPSLLSVACNPFCLLVKCNSKLSNFWLIQCCFAAIQFNNYFPSNWTCLASQKGGGGVGTDTKNIPQLLR